MDDIINFIKQKTITTISNKLNKDPESMMELYFNTEYQYYTKCYIDTILHIENKKYFVDKDDYIYELFENTKVIGICLGKINKKLIT